MEVPRKRLLQKHLEPARPLHRCTQVSQAMNKCSDEMLKNEGMMRFNDATRPVTESLDYKITLEQFFKIMNLNKPKERISYSRDFLISLASCQEAKKKPVSLPEHPIVLAEVRGGSGAEW